MEEKSHKSYVWVLLIALMVGCWALNRALPPKLPQPVDMADRVYMLSQTWHMASNIYGYFELLPEDFDWDEAYYEALEAVMQGGSDYDFYCALERFSAKLMDGHTHVVPGDNDFLGQMPAQFQYLEGKYVLVGASGKMGDCLGWWLTEVDGRPIERYIDEEIAPLVPRQTPLGRQQNIADRMVLGPIGEQLTLTLETDGGERQSFAVEFGRKPLDRRLPLYQSKRGTVYSSPQFRLTIYRDNIAHLHMPTFSRGGMVEEFYESVMPLIADCDGVILDIRGNGGGNSLYAQQILEAFVDDPIPHMGGNATQVKRADDMVYGSWFVYPNSIAQTMPDLLAALEGEASTQRGIAMLKNRYYVHGDPEKNDAMGNALLMYESGLEAQDYFTERPNAYRRLDVPCVVLLDHEAVSAADTAADLAQQAGLVTMGTRTAGSTGNNFTLPFDNGWSVSFTSVRAMRHDGSDYWNVGVEADIYVEQTIEDAIAGIDTQLRAALDYIEARA